MPRRTIRPLTMSVWPSALDQSPRTRWCPSPSTRTASMRSTRIRRTQHSSPPASSLRTAPCWRRTGKQPASIEQEKQVARGTAGSR